MKTVYLCEICKDEFDDPEDADRCEARGTTGPFDVEVGDIVGCSKNWGWYSTEYENASEWIRNPENIPFAPGVPGNKRKVCPRGDSNCFAECCLLSFYWVVTAIEPKSAVSHRDEGHDCAYHIATKAVHWGGGDDVEQGWTSGDHHRIWKIEEPPPFIVADSRDIICLKRGNIL